MDAPSLDYFRLIYGFTFFAMGLAVVVRASAYSTSRFRNRLLALGASGLFHAGGSWLTLEAVAESGLPPYFRTTFYLAGYLALYYFAFGWNERRPKMVHAIALGMIFGLVTADILIADSALMESVRRLGVGLPVAVCVALAFMYDSSFRFGSRSSDAARWVIAVGFMVYAALHLFPQPADAFPASVLNSATFEAATGMSTRVLRGGTILVITVGLLALLNRFDVVLRQQTENALATSEARLKKALEISKLGSWEWNIATGESRRSDNVYKILGVGPEQLDATFAGYLERVHPDDRTVVEEVMRRTLDQHTPFKIDYRIVRPDGTVRFIQAHGEVEVGPDGAARKVLGTIHDVTELEAARKAVRDKEAEDRLRKSEERLREAERVALIGYWEVDVKRGEFLRSDQSVRNLGLEPGEMGPGLEGFLECVHPDDREMVRADIEARKKWLTPDEYEFRTLWPNGEVRILRSKYRFEVDEAGALTKMFGVTQDITERKQAEAAAISKEQQLRQAQKMEAVGQLTGGIAHDFNNLLAVINGSLEFVAEAVSEGTIPEQQWVEAAIRSGQRGAELVRRLLSFARQMPLRPELTRIDQIILDTTSLLRHTLGETIEVEVRPRAEGTTTLVDRNQLGGALVNLALNARDAMPEGGKLTVEATVRPAGRATSEGAAKWPTGKEVCIKVTDTGTGMSAEVREHAMEPFFTTKPIDQGSGLGLSMVYEFVEQSGGYIDIDSEVGRGTTIMICLPHVLAVEYAAEPDVSEPRALAENEKVALLVEDDPDVRAVTKAQLKRLGYTVHAVANGDEALDLLASPVIIDIVVTDLVLPGGIDGIRVIREALRVRPKIGVICMSGYAASQDRRDWLGAQNIRLLDKPFAHAKLGEALNELRS